MSYAKITLDLIGHKRAPQIGDRVRGLPSADGKYLYTCHGWEGVVRNVEGDRMYVEDESSPFLVETRYFEVISV